MEELECNLEYEEMVVPDYLYRCQFSNRLVDNNNEEKRELDNNDETSGSADTGVESSAGSHRGGTIKKEQDSEEINIEVNALGKNGWHRILNMLQPLPMDNATSSSSSESLDKLIPSLQALNPIGESSDSNSNKDSSSTNYNTTLDQRTAINILQNPHHPQHVPILSEEEALRYEYETLQREIESLEKDRVALECQFNEIEVEKFLLSLRGFEESVWA